MFKFRSLFINLLSTDIYRDEYSLLLGLVAETVRLFLRFLKRLRCLGSEAEISQGRSPTSIQALGPRHRHPKYVPKAHGFSLTLFAELVEFTNVTLISKAYKTDVLTAFGVQTTRS